MLTKKERGDLISNLLKAEKSKNAIFYNYSKLRGFLLDGKKITNISQSKSHTIQFITEDANIFIFNTEKNDWLDKIVLPSDAMIYFELCYKDFGDIGPYMDFKHRVHCRLLRSHDGKYDFIVLSDDGSEFNMSQREFLDLYFRDVIFMNCEDKTKKYIKFPDNPSKQMDSETTQIMTQIQQLIVCLRILDNRRFSEFLKVFNYNNSRNETENFRWTLDGENPNIKNVVITEYYKVKSPKLRDHFLKSIRYIVSEHLEKLNIDMEKDLEKVYLKEPIEISDLALYFFTVGGNIVFPLYDEVFDHITGHKPIEFNFHDKKEVLPLNCHFLRYVKNY